MMLIDTHAHLDFSDFDHDRDKIFASMRESGIQGAIIPAVETCHWDRVKSVAHQYDCFYALGIHPWMMTANKLAQDVALLDAYLQANQFDKRLVAVGETGLDGLKGPTLQVQQAYLQAHIRLAEHYQLPIIIHAVRAHETLLNCLKNAVPSRGVIHGFSGSLEVAQAYVKLGYFLGIGGLLLNPNAKKLRRAVALLPLEFLLVETDAPAMSPIPNSRNTPMLLPKVVNEIAKLRNKSPDYIAKQLLLNYRQLFER